MSDFIIKLLGGEGYPISRISEAAEEVLEKPELFREVLAGMFTNHSDLRVRCADVVERVSAQHPELLEPFKADILRLAGDTSDHSLRWQLVLLLPRLWLFQKDYDTVFSILEKYLQDQNEVVRMYSMESLARLSRKEKALRLRGLRLLDELKHHPNLSMRSRAEQLYKKLRELDAVP